MTKILINADELARVIGVPAKSIYLYAQKGILPSVRIGKHLRFEPSEVVAKLKLDGVDCLAPGSRVNKGHRLSFDELAKLVDPSRSLKTGKSLTPEKGVKNGSKTTT